MAVASNSSPKRRRGAVCVDVADLVRLRCPRIAQRIAHHAEAAFALGRRLR